MVTGEGLDMLLPHGEEAFLALNDVEVANSPLPIGGFQCGKTLLETRNDV